MGATPNERGDCPPIQLAEFPTWRRWSRAGTTPRVRTFYQRLQAACKPKKLALVAVMRKLLRCSTQWPNTNTEWQQQAA